MADTRAQAPRGLDNRIPPPLVFLLVAGVMGLWAAALPGSGLGGPWSWAPGAGLLLLAGLAGPPAIRRFGRAGTTIDPVAIERACVLVTEGVHRWTRNPMYPAMAALLGAIVACTAQPWLLPGPIAFVLFITRLQTLPGAGAAGWPGRARVPQASMRGAARAAAIRSLAWPPSPRPGPTATSACGNCATSSWSPS